MSLQPETQQEALPESSPETLPETLPSTPDHHGASETAPASAPRGSFVRHVLLALQYFTRLPLPDRVAAWVGFSPAMMKAASAHFPGVGWLVGLAAAGVLWLGTTFLKGPVVAVALVAAVLSTMATVWLTGAMHEDGLADVGDGLGGSADRETALRIMKDSRLGAFGALTLVLVLVLKIGLLTLLLSQAGMLETACAVIATHVFSRWAAMLLPHRLPYVGGRRPGSTGKVADHVVPAGTADSTGAAGAAETAGTAETAGATGSTGTASAAATSGTTGTMGDGSKARSLVEALDRKSALTAFLWALIAFPLLYAGFGLFHSVSAILVVVLAARRMEAWFRRRLGGITGDCLGATQQIVEVAMLLVLCIHP